MTPAIIEADVYARSHAGIPVASIAARQPGACPVCGGALTMRRTLRGVASAPAKLVRVEHVCLGCETTVSRRLGRTS